MARVALILLCLSRVAQAQTLAPSDELLQGHMRLYYRGEKTGALWFAGAGIAAAAVGGVLASRPEDLVRGMSYPILGVALIELLAGVVLYFRTDRQLAGLERDLHADPAELRERERKRMIKVNRQFRMVEGLELALLFGGIATAAGSAAASNDTWTGVGIGLTVQAAAMLAMDRVAHHRSKDYLRALEGVNVAIATDHGQSRVMLGFRRAW